MYGLSLPIGDRIVAVADVRRIDVIGAGSPPKDGEAGVPKPLAVVPEYQLLIGESRSVVGSMRSFEDGIYEIETRFGPVRVPVADVTRIDVTWMSALGETGVANPDGGSVLTQGQLRFAGSNVMGESLVPALLEAYVARGRALSTLWVSGTTAHERSFVALAPDRKKFVASINRRGTASAWEALIDGSADIGMMSRQMSSEESQRFAAARPGKPPIQVEEHVVALGGVVVLVHPSNPIKLLRLDQIADIFSGRVRNWSEFGGVPRRIRVIAPPEGSGILEVFRARVLHGRAIDPLIARTSSNTEISVLVGSDPTAIGLSEFAYVRNATAIAITDECGLTHTPSEFSIQTEEYPSVRPELLSIRQGELRAGGATLCQLCAVHSWPEPPARARPRKPLANIGIAGHADRARWGNRLGCCGSPGDREGVDGLFGEGQTPFSDFPIRVGLR